MSDLDIITEVRITANLNLTEGQLRALDALAVYGDDAFLKAFYIKLGKHYMQPFEADLRELFRAIRRDVPEALLKVEAARGRLGIPTSSGKWIKKGGTQ